jgi:uncharacterized protein YceH (UPF0502 family)
MVSINNAAYLHGKTLQTEEEYPILLQSLQEENQKLLREIKKLEIEKAILQEKYDLLTYKRFVRSSEQENTTQQSLFNEGPADFSPKKQAIRRKSRTRSNQRFTSTSNMIAGSVRDGNLYLKKYRGK